MTNTLGLLDKARDLCSPSTDYQLAKILGISHGVISRARNHGKTLDNAAVFKLAIFLQQDPAQVLAMVELDRAKNDEARRFWEKLAPRMVSSLVIGVLAATSYGVSGPSQAQDLSVKPAFYSLYIMRHVARWLRRRARAAKSLSRASYQSCHA